MKIKINRNITWAETFISILTSAGVKYACISPGSRSTPLTYAAAKSSLKSYIHIDERSGGFFATGLARASQSPVLLICTSGTAAAEFYPAVIESYQQRIPLIVCTADRPSGAYLRGINQTINQNNLYKNHIQWFTDAGLPDASNLNRIRSIAVKALDECLNSSRPVHINFPFEKPFEPENTTDEVDQSSIFPVFYSPAQKDISVPDIKKIAEIIISEPKGIITAGPGCSSSFKEEIITLSEITGYPVFADGASGLRFGGDGSSRIFNNYDAIVRAGYLQKNKPSVILHFGRNLTSKPYEEFLNKYNGRKYIINKSGDLFDPAGRFDSLITSDETIFINTLTNYFDAAGFRRTNSQWFFIASEAEASVCRIKEELIYNNPFPDEARIIPEIIRLLPEKCSLMISNSMPIRDFDYFAQSSEKNIKVYHNRGASGIDGILSTALGIAAAGEKTILVTGDLAFYHDLNGLIASKNYNIPLVIVLINNNGGGIFRALPISAYKDIFTEYFITPHNLSFDKFVDAYGGNYKLIDSWADLAVTFNSAVNSDGLAVLEISTDSGESIENRRRFWEKVKEKFSDTGII
jgi:2-succinyl-5-enolpyruvyl-6-hydroxy-3-cyclohexene-1-carboxylate synthase